MINVAIYLVVLYHIFDDYNERTYLLFVDKLIYQFYIGDKLAQQSHFHNIFIRLSKQIASDERMLVNLVLDGYGIEPHTLTSEYTC